MENSLEDQRATENGTIPYGIIKCISKGIARGDDRSIYTATLMKLSFEENKTFIILLQMLIALVKKILILKVKLTFFMEN